MSTYYNKSNSKVKESSEQSLIEMSISNGVIGTGKRDETVWNCLSKG
jgi:hypothetical protein